MLLHKSPQRIVGLKFELSELLPADQLDLRSFYSDLIVLLTHIVSIQAEAALNSVFKVDAVAPHTFVHSDPIPIRLG